MVTELGAFAANEWAVCRYCRAGIERRRVIGWVHVEGFYLCATQPNEDTYNHATPWQPAAATASASSRVKR